MSEQYNKAELISERMRNLRVKAMQAKDARLSFMDKLWSRMRLNTKEDQLLADIMKLICNTLNTSASALLLLGADNEEFLFNVDKATEGRQFKRLPVEMQSDVARWVMQNHRPMMVNDIDQSRLLYRSIDQVTGFTTKSVIGVALKLNGKVAGVIEAYNKQDDTDFNRQDAHILSGMATTVGMALENARSNLHVLNSYKSTVNALVSLADAKETSGGGHSRRVSKYAMLGAAGMGYTGKTKQTIEYAAILHDIGKLSIPDSLLNKAENPDDEEWEIIREHPVVGYELLKEIPMLQESSKLILYHHERYDGTGYPQKLSGDDIPMGARLIAIADAFDNMTTEHSYRKALTGSEAFKELDRCSGSQFCPYAIMAFKKGFLRSRNSRK